MGLLAREIKSELLKEGFAYITEETEHPASKHASAAWERLYNTFSMRQIFEYTFGEFNPEVRWWIAPQSETVQDPVDREFCMNPRPKRRKILNIMSSVRVVL